MPHANGESQPPRSRTLGVRVTEREWREVNRLADERGTSVDALLREWGVEPLVEIAGGGGVAGRHGEGGGVGGRRAEGGRRDGDGCRDGEAARERETSGEAGRGCGRR